MSRKSAAENVLEIVGYIFSLHILSYYNFSSHILSCYNFSSHILSCYNFSAHSLSCYNSVYTFYPATISVYTFHPVTIQFTYFIGLLGGKCPINHPAIRMSLQNLNWKQRLLFPKSATKTSTVSANDSIDQQSIYMYVLHKSTFSTTKVSLSEC